MRRKGGASRLEAALGEAQNEMAKVVIDRVPSVEMVRFVNSGTEACLSVLRLMRAYTGREKASCPTPPSSARHCACCGTVSQMTGLLCGRMAYSSCTLSRRTEDGLPHKYLRVGEAAHATQAAAGPPASIAAPLLRWSHDAGGALSPAGGSAAQLVKFTGCYHGHADSFLVQAGSGVLTLGLPDSPGVPKSSTGAEHPRPLCGCCSCAGARS